MTEEATDGWVITYEDTASTLNQSYVAGVVEVADSGDLLVFNRKSELVAVYADGIWRDARRIRLKLLPEGIYEPEAEA